MSFRQSVILLTVSILIPAKSFAAWKTIAGPICTSNQTAPTDITGATMLVGFARGSNPTVELTDSEGDGGWAKIGRIDASTPNLASYWRFFSTPSQAKAYVVKEKRRVSFCYYALAGPADIHPLVVTKATTKHQVPKVAIDINHTDALILTAESGAAKSGPTGFTANIYGGTLGTAYKVDRDLGEENPIWANATETVALVFRSEQSINRIGQGPCSQIAGQTDANGVIANTERTTVENAVSAAQPGAVICLPSSGGTATTWTSTVYQLGGKELRGAGVQPAMGSPEQTRIYMGFSPGANGGLGFSRSGLLQGYVSNSYPTMIDGIFFSADQDSGFPEDGMINFNDTVQDASFSEPAISHHNDYLIDNRCTDPVINKAWVRSAIFYRNRAWAFPYNRSTGVGCGLDGSGQPNGTHVNTNIQFAQTYINRDAGNSLIWHSPPTKGTADGNGLNNVYVENNEIHGFAVGTDCGEVCRAVWRFNLLDSTTLATHGADSVANGVRHMEIYGNTFTCESITSMRAFTATRGGSLYYFYNSFPATPIPGTTCDPDNAGIPTGNEFYIFRIAQCSPSGSSVGWWGAYPGNWPVHHQLGWGYNPGDTINPNLVSVPGAMQNLEPMYEFANTYGAGTVPWSAPMVEPNGCQSPAGSASAKGTAGTQLTAQTRINTGQWALAVFTDQGQVGSAEPTITNTCDEGGANQAQNWSPAQGGDNGTMRMRAWITHIARDCVMNTTVSFASSSGARSLAVAQVRGLDAMALDQNPPVVTQNATASFSSPAITTALTPITTTTGFTGEILLHYAAMSVPRAHNLTVAGGAAPYVTRIASYCAPNVCGQVGGHTSRNGTDNCFSVTNGWTSDTAGTCPPDFTFYPGPNLSTLVSFRNWPGGGTVGAGAMVMQDSSGSGDSISGIIAFRAGENNPGPSPCSGVDPRPFYQGRPEPASCLDNRILDYFQSGVEYFSEAKADGMAAHGPRSMRPPCTKQGQGYFSTDQGNWNKLGVQQGVLDRCIAPGNPGTWENAWYVPKDYPHPRADVVAGGDVNVFTTQPTNTLPGAQFSPVVAGIVYPPAPDSLTISLDSTSAPCPLSGTLTTTAASDGRWTFPGLGLQAGTPVAGCRVKVHNNTNSAMADAVSNLFTMIGTITITGQPGITLVGQTLTPIQVTLNPPAPGATLVASISQGACQVLGLPMTITGTTFSGLTATALGNCVIRIENMSNPAYVAGVTNPFNVQDSLSFGHDFSGFTTVSIGFYGPTCRNVVAPEDGTLLTIRAYVVGFVAGEFLRGAIYSGTVQSGPQALIAQGTGVPITMTGGTGIPASYASPISASITGGTSYWLCVRGSTGDNGLAFTNAANASDFGWLDCSTNWPNFPNPFGAGCFSPINRNHFINATYLPNAQAALSFTSPGPTSTVSGQTMASFGVAATGGLTGNVTLAPNNCSGVSFTGLTAAISGTTATFNMIVPTAAATVNGCTFTASASGATGATSNSFNVTVTPTLSWLVQPSNTTPGVGFNPVVVIHSSPPITTGNATITVASPPCGINFTGAVAAFDSSGNATFTNLVPNNTGTGCHAIGHASGATDTPNSGVFQVTTAPVLTWTVQPSNTVSGMVITPAPQVQATPATADQVQVMIESGNCGFGAGSTTTVTASGAGVATFSNLIINATTEPPQTCIIKTFNNTHPTFVFYSSPFDVTGNVVLSSLTFPNTVNTVYADGIFRPTVEVHSSDSTFGGQITLTAINCAAVSLTAGQTATATNGVAFFPDLRSSMTEGYGCALRASAAGHTYGDSNTFWNLGNVPAPQPDLAFDPQPQNTQTGHTMTSFAVHVVQPQSRIFLGRSGTVTLMPNNCGASFSPLTAALDVNGTATFDMTVASGEGGGCHFVASSPGANDTVSDGFNVVAPGAQVSRTEVPSRMRAH